MSIPPIGESSFYNVNSDSPGSFDDNYTLAESINAVWEAAQACQANPSALNVQVFVQAMNTANTDMNALISKNGAPSQSNNPNAYQFYQFITASIDPNTKDTLASICSTIPPTQATIGYFQSEIGSMMISGVYNSINSWQTRALQQDSHNMSCQDDLQDLVNDIQTYEAQKTPQLAKKVALDIQNLITDLQSIKGDGYLTILGNLFNTSINSSSDTLAKLAAPITSGDSVSPPSTNLQNFMNALNSTSGTGTVGSDLAWLVSFSYKEEFNS